MRCAPFRLTPEGGRDTGAIWGAININKTKKGGVKAWMSAFFCTFVNSGRRAAKCGPEARDSHQESKKKDNQQEKL